MGKEKKEKNQNKEENQTGEKQEQQDKQVEEYGHSGGWGCQDSFAEYYRRD